MTEKTMIRVICADISHLTEADYRLLYEKASPERRARADRYRHREDALRCVTADALLCYVLGTADYRVGKASFGKPFIEGKEQFHYNLSHSGSWVVLACGNREVGVDVEHINRDTDVDAVANRFFSPDERQYLRQKPGDSRSRFFEIWTGKESYLKYLGTGLKRDLTSFSIFRLEPPVRLYHRELDEAHCLSLCAACDDYSFELLDVQHL